MAMKILRTTSPVVTVVSAHWEETVAFYERLTGEACRARLKNAAGTLDLALVGTTLVIGGDEAALASRRQMKATYIIDSLNEWREALVTQGVAIVEEPARGPMRDGNPLGTFMFVRHADGGLFEYFEPDR
jgi:hypothetical protein